MNILIVQNTRIPVFKYGGIERVIWWLGKDLNRLGHKIYYLVPEGSTCPFAGILTYDPSKSLNEQIPEFIDIVHLHFQPNEPIDKPYLVTCHCNYHPKSEFDINTVFVSAHQARMNKSDLFVHHGLDFEDYGPVDFKKPREHLLFLGYAKRPEKNLADCQYIARETRNKLVVVGARHRWWRWRPWLEYKGFIGGDEKNRVMQSTKALLFPVRWHEPFGLAILESLYFGCPVIGSEYGALPELITNGYGFLSNYRSKLVDAVSHIDFFERKKIHEYACDRFNVRRMTNEYLALYQRVMNQESLNPRNPVNGSNFTVKELLPLYQ